MSPQISKGTYRRMHGHTNIPTNIKTVVHTFGWMYILMQKLADRHTAIHIRINKNPYMSVKQEKMPTSNGIICPYLMLRPTP